MPPSHTTCGTISIPSYEHSGLSLYIHPGDLAGSIAEQAEEIYLPSNVTPDDIIATIGPCFSLEEFHTSNHVTSSNIPICQIAIPSSEENYRAELLNVAKKGDTTGHIEFMDGLTIDHHTETFLDNNIRKVHSSSTPGLVKTEVHSHKPSSTAIDSSPLTSLHPAKFLSSAEGSTKGLLVTPPPCARRSSTTPHKHSKKIVLTPQRKALGATLDNGRVRKRVREDPKLKAASDRQGHNDETSRPQSKIPASFGPTFLPKDPRESSNEPREDLERIIETPATSTERAISGQFKRSSRKRKEKVAVSPPLPHDPDPPKKFICNVNGCEMKFRRSEHLKRHTRSVHTLDKLYVCPICDKGFSRTDNFQQHLRVHGRNSAGRISAPTTTENFSNKDEEEAMAEVVTLPVSPGSTGNTVV